MSSAVSEPTAVDVSDLEAEIRAFNAAAELPTPRAGQRSGLDWRLVIDTSNDAFVSVDAAGVISEWNVRAEALFGWSREEVVGRRLEETIFPPQGAGSGVQVLTQAGQEGKRLETIATRRDGRELPTEISMSMMQRDGEIVFNAFIHDITTRRELQAQLAHGQKLESIGQLSAGIAHEINTPTQYVGDNTRFIRDALDDVYHVLDAYADLAEEVRQGRDAGSALPRLDAAIEEADLAYVTTELRDAVNQSLEGVDRVASIVRAMKEFSHPGSAAKTPTNLNDAIAATITVATNEWKYVAEIETRFDASLPLTPCLPGDFNQVILNIIVNAAHAIGEKIDGKSREKGLITVSTSREDEWARVEITDTGTGIPPEVLNRVFDPFFTTKDVGIGTGQGLAISRSVVVDKHDGTLDVHSVVGVGSTFTIRIPLAPEAGQGANE